MPVMLLQPGRRPMFPPTSEIVPDEDGLVALFGDIDPETILEAYGKGVFPWDGRQPYPWFSPDPRCVLEPSAFVASDSLRKLWRQGKLDVRVDTAFSDVMWACARAPRRGQDGTWISAALVASYTALHRQGVAHSVEVWEAGVLVGGLYGLAIGRAFFGESMFATRRDASKIALYRLTVALAEAGFHFVDCQQDTPHLRSLGAVTIPRSQFLGRLEAAISAGDGWAEVKRAARWSDGASMDSTGGA
jgi:leucyl/phenylalanyl-tRNA--protein transferase